MKKGDLIIISVDCFLEEVLEGNREQIPEIHIPISAVPINAKTKKLKVRWTVEPEQDLAFYDQANEPVYDYEKTGVFIGYFEYHNSADKRKMAQAFVQELGRKYWAEKRYLRPFTKQDQPKKILVSEGDVASDAASRLSRFLW